MGTVSIKQFGVCKADAHQLHHRGGQSLFDSKFIIYAIIGGDEAGLAPPAPGPSLARSLHALSTPRPLDNLTPDLVEKLPSEGIYIHISA